MIIVDKALEKRQREGNPVRVGMVGAGAMGQGIALQILSVVPGMELVAISNRNVGRAKEAYAQAGVENVRVVETTSQLEAAIAQGAYAITDDAMLLCEAEGIDAVIEVTGAVEFGAHVVMKALEHRKHVILMNAELDATLGPILKMYADKAGVIITNADGDQPGVEMNLYRFVKGLGMKPVMCGSMKGLHDAYRNPTTQEGFARKWKQDVYMVTSFADGSKVSFEQAVVANATGMKVARRGMIAPTVLDGTHIQEAVKVYQLETLTEGSGIIEYIVGAVPGPGVFVLARNDHPTHQHYLDLYKLGTGPFYCFYTPYHLCYFEVHNTVARAVLFNDATIAPLGAPVVDVVATAKIDLKAGTTLDGIGGYMTYGQCENSDIVQAEQLLPMGLAGGCRLKRDIAKDTVLTYADIELPTGRLCDKLRAEQNAYFASLPSIAVAG